MSELSVDTTEQEQTDEPVATNAPLMLAIGFAIALLALFVAVGAARGQTAANAADVAFGSLAGRVSSPDGRPLTGVRVMARRVHAGVANFHFDRVTSADGSFEFRYLLPGRYTVEIDCRTVPDSIFPAMPKLILADVTANTAVTAELVLVRSAVIPATASRGGTKP